MSNEFKEIVREIQHREKLTIEEVASEIGYSRAHFNRIMNSGGNSKLLTLLMQRWPDVAQSVRSDADSEMIASEPSASYISQRRVKKSQKVVFTAPLVPVKARAGYVSSYDQTDFLDTLEQYALPPGVDPRGAVWRYFEVDGDSMEPTFGAGDVLLASMVPHDDWQEIRNFYVYVIVTDTQVLVKRLYRKSEAKWIMISDNEDVYPQEILQVNTIKELWVFRRLIQNKAPVPKKFEIKL